MKEEKTPITLEEVVENYGVLRLWYFFSCGISIFLICCMIGAVVWGIFYPELRWIIISAGIIMGICGAVVFIVVRRTYIKTSSTVLDYFKVACKMSDDEIREKAKELKIPKKVYKTL